MIKEELERVGAVAKQLNVLGTQMREAVDAVDRTLRKSAAPGDHTYARPLSEQSYEGEGGREIVLSFLAFWTINGVRQLAIVQKRVFESRLAGQSQGGRQVVTPLRSADLGVLYLCYDHLTAFANLIRTDGQAAEDVDDLFDDAPTRLVRTALGR